MSALFDSEGWEQPRHTDRWCSVRCFNHDDRTASARVHMDAGAFICMACGIHAGSPAGLLMAAKGMDWGRAADHLRGLGIDPRSGEERAVDTGPKRPWKGRRARSGAVNEWRRARA